MRKIDIQFVREYDQMTIKANILGVSKKYINVPSNINGKSGQKA